MILAAGERDGVALRFPRDGAVHDWTYRQLVLRVRREGAERGQVGHYEEFAVGVQPSGQGSQGGGGEEHDHLYPLHVDPEAGGGD